MVLLAADRLFRYAVRKCCLSGRSGRSHAPHVYHPPPHLPSMIVLLSIPQNALDCVVSPCPTVGVPRSMPSPWLVWCAALQTAALVVLITWFLFLWAAVEQAEKKLPSVLLLGAERAAAQGHMLVSVRLTALHALRVRSHSSPVVFQVIPASAAFNVIVGAMSVGTVYEMVAVAAKFLADPCASSFAAGSHEHSAVVDTVVEGATPDVIVIPTPSGLLPFEVAVDHLIAVADTLVSLVWEA